MVVEVDQPDAQVCVDGREIEVRLAGEKGPIEIKVTEGTHELKVKKDGFETITRDFSYHKGDKVVVQVRLETNKPIVTEMIQSGRQGRQWGQSPLGGFRVSLQRQGSIGLATAKQTG